MSAPKGRDSGGMHRRSNAAGLCQRAVSGAPASPLAVAVSPGEGPGDLLREAVRLQEAGEPFALATVVRAERPTSARPGAKALVTPDGRVLGFVGGACVRPSVLRESLRALEDGEPRLLRISPDAPPPGVSAPEGVLEEVMACVSGGALDIHIEPHLPKKRLAVFGESPVAQACRSLGAALGFAVEAPPAEEAALEGAVVVVALHGESEGKILRAALAEGRAAWVGLVASPRRAEAVRADLRRQGLSEADIARLASPAGLDIGAETAAEIALSIFAQVVADIRRPAAVEREAAQPAEPAPIAISLAADPPADPPEVFVDPICGMTVRADSPHRLEGEDGPVLFCCGGCLDRYQAASPQATA